MHQAEILRLQRLAVGGSPAHPYSPTLILPAYIQPGDLNLDQGERWRPFLLLITDQRISERQFAAKQLNAGAKADWLNDIIFSGYLKNVLPDVEERPPPRVRGYLSQCWANNNCWMELQHNYVQWWWPNAPVGMGDGIAPRWLETTRQTLTDHGQIFSVIQGMLVLSFARMVTFWGHKLDSSLKLVPLSAAESHGLGIPVKGVNWHENWVINGHNYQRMTRILVCLNYFKLRAYADSLYTYLEETALSLLDDHSMRGSLNRYWSQVRNG